MELCQPSSTILLVSVAGVIYHILTGNYYGMTWWIMVGLFGTGIFQALCYGGLEVVAWVLMAIPLLIVCFFLAVALFASRMRIQTVTEVPCDACGRPRHHGSCFPTPTPPVCQSCNRDSCSRCGQEEGFASGMCPYCLGVRGGCPRCFDASADAGFQACPRCGGSGCPFCG